MGLVPNSRKKQAFFIFIFMIFSSFIEVVSIGAIMPFLGSIIEPNLIRENILYYFDINPDIIANDNDLIIYSAILFILLSFLSVMVRIAFLFVETKFVYAFAHDFGLYLFKLTIHQPYNKFIERRSSDLISLITQKVSWVANLLIRPFINILSAIVLISFVSVIIIINNPIIFISSFAVILTFYSTIVFISRKKIKNTGSNINFQSARLIRILQESIGNIREIIIHSNYSLISNIFKTHDKSLKNSQITLQILAGYPKYIIELILMLFVASVIIYFSGSRENLTVVIPTIAVFAMGTQRLLPVVQLAFTGWTNIKNGQSSFEELQSFINSTSIYYKSEKNDVSTSTIDFRKSIIFHNVSFAFNKNKILDNVNLEIKKGDKIGLIGKSGCGKSTFFDLILGLIKPDTGKITIDGDEINLDEFKNWGKVISHIPQRIFLTDDTLEENIAQTSSANYIDKGLINECIAKSELSKKINSLEDGVKSSCGENGIELSGGERQRIGIARAFYASPQILLLDEATSALDSNTESKVMEKFFSLQETTLIIIAHRLSTLSGCNRIFQLNKGSLTELSVNDMQKIKKSK